VAIADCYDALTTTRPYQRAHHPGEAVRIIQGQAGTAYRPDLVERFVGMLGTYPVGEAVRLTTGEIAVVVVQNPLDATAPRVRLATDPDGNPLAETPELDLAEPSEAKRRIVAALDPLSKGIDVAAILENDPEPGS